MSKTVSTCILETNQIQNKPQENIFFHTLYRTQADYPNEFLRTARSTSPIQICAIFSCIGPDNHGAMLNLELNSELANIVAETQKNPVLDFEVFAQRVINVLNVKVCNYSVTRGGVNVRVSMTMLIIEGDTLRVIHIGNTKAVLVRDNKIMALTEEHTVAHRYVQMGAITAEQEKTHPDNMNLTQYLGKLPQDGPIAADKKVHLKLKDNDELCLMGLGISHDMPTQMRNVILVRPSQTETKAREIINSAYSYGIKAGLSVALIKVESTFLLPGDAVINSNLASDGTMAKTEREEEVRPYTPLNEPTGYSSFDDEDEGTQKFNVGNMNETITDKEESDMKEVKERKKRKLWNVLVPLITFVVCIGIGYGVMYLVFNAKHLLDAVTTVSSEESEEVHQVLYILNDNTPVYSEASLDSTVISTLNRGDAVTLITYDEQFSTITTASNITGYVLNVQMSTEDPTIGEELPVIEADPTPVPTTQSQEFIPDQTLNIPNTPATEPVDIPTEATTAATEAPTEATTEATEATSETSAPEANETTAATSETPAETTAAPTETQAPDTAPETPMDEASNGEGA